MKSSIRGLFLLVIVICATPAYSVDLIQNGEFDTGANRWNIAASSGNGSWFLDSVGTPTPLTGLPTTSVGGGENLYAVTDQTGPGITVLWQRFTVPGNIVSANLSFDMFVNDWSSQPGFDINQHGRVDLMTGSASPFDVGNGIVTNLFLGTDGGPLPNEFLHYEFNLAPFLSPGETYQIRFYEVDTRAQVTIGVDNVHLEFVPEPPSESLFLLLAALLFGLWRLFCRSTSANLL